MPDARHSRRFVAATATALLATIVVTLSFALYQARNSELDDWRGQLDNTTLLLAQQTFNELSAADLVLDGMLERVSSLRIADGAMLRERMGSEAEFQRLRDRKKALPQIDVATVVDSAGKVITFTRSFPAPPITLADRDYFSAHRNQPGAATYVSRPVRNKGDGTWTFYLSRRISAPDGRFLGVALVGLSCRRLSDFFSKINLGDDATVTLYRRDFTTLARWPHREDQMGVANRSGTSYEIIERRGLESGVLVLDTARQAQAGARVKRMGAARLIPRYPMLINVTVTERLFMAQWRRFAWQLGTMGALCGTAVLAAFVILLREMRRRDAAMRQQRALKAQADAANRAKGDFLAMISHEIRTPLTAVIGFAEQIEHARTAQDAAELGSVITRNGQLLLALINDILDMSKVESGKLVLERAAFPPREALAAVAMLMAGQARKRGIAFTTSVAPDCPDAVLGDTIRWRQILMNLVSNAIKFTDHGSVSVHQWYEVGGQRLYCRVSDTGIGMDPGLVARLFAPFEQADSSIARRFGGTGLGLYLVRQLAQAMGGEVTVVTQPGQGTAVTVVMHAPPAEMPASARRPADSGQPGQRLAGRVLLVEDSTDNRRLIAAMLAQRGLQVQCAADGAQAVAMATNQPYDLILMDIRMPVLDGVAAVKALRTAGCKVPIVALTANVSAEDRASYEAKGFDGCLAKPVERQAFDLVLAGFLPPAEGLTTFADLPEFADIRAAFVGGLAERLAALRQAFERGDLAAMRMEAHKLKGSAASFGCPATGTCAADLERACVLAFPDGCRSALDTLSAEARREAPGAFRTEHSA